METTSKDPMSKKDKTVIEALSYCLESDLDAEENAVFETIFKDDDLKGMQRVIHGATLMGFRLGLCKLSEFFEDIGEEREKKKPEGVSSEEVEHRLMSQLILHLMMLKEVESRFQSSL